MKIGTPALSRLTPEDRNMTVVLRSYFGVLGHHGITQRFEYTVPANRRAIISSLRTAISVETPAFTESRCACVILLLPFGGTIEPIKETVNVFAGVVPTVSSEIAPQTFLNAGDSIGATSEDATSGGNKIFSLGLIINEFDA